MVAAGAPGIRSTAKGDWKRGYGQLAGSSASTAPGVLELYERYKIDPGSVDAETRALFASAGRRPKTPRAASTSVSGDALEKAIAAVELAHSIRRYGHLAARSIRSATRRLAIRRSTPRRTV